jgi:hypothetical protein
MSSALHSTPGNRGTTGTTSPLCPWAVPLGGRRRPGRGRGPGTGTTGTGNHLAGRAGVDA